jgi:hypothetical protein
LVALRLTIDAGFQAKAVRMAHRWLDAVEGDPFASRRRVIALLRFIAERGDTSFSKSVGAATVSICAQHSNEQASIAPVACCNTAAALPHNHENMNEEL